MFLSEIILLKQENIATINFIRNYLILAGKHSYQYILVTLVVHKGC